MSGTAVQVCPSRRAEKSMKIFAIGVQGSRWESWEGRVQTGRPRYWDLHGGFVTSFDSTWP